MIFWTDSKPNDDVQEIKTDVKPIQFLSSNAYMLVYSKKGMITLCKSDVEECNTDFLITSSFFANPKRE